MKIVICTDFWDLQWGGGVPCILQNVISVLEKKGHGIQVLKPSLFPHVPFPFYAERKMGLAFFSSIRKALPQQFDAVHIATEAPLGFQMSRYCAHHGIPFTTSYMTNIPENMKKYALVPESFLRTYLRWFHKRSQKIFIPAEHLKKKLESWGLTHTVHCPLGVDTALFYPRKVSKQQDKILLYVGRVAKTKNLEAFLRCKVQAQKYIVGDGPIKKSLQKRYPDVHFLGFLQGEKLADAYSMADVFVFPSKIDTFGLVMLEALACGVPIAAFPVEGPLSVVTDPRLGCLSENLEEAIEIALERGDKSYCREYARTFSWEHSAQQFLENLVLHRM